MTAAETTVDHATIKEWAERRNGHPAKIGTDRPGAILRIDSDEPEERLKPVSWDQLFEIFEINKLAFLYQEKTIDGRLSCFKRFIGWKS